MFHAFQMALFPVAVITLFWKHRIGLGMEEILLLQALFGLSMAVCEFPSGYVADRIGYRNTLILAALVNVVAWVLFYFAEGFTGFLAAEVLLGLGTALVSGCDSALLYESLRDLDDEASFARWSGRMKFFGQSAEGTAALLAGVFYAWWPRFPFLLEVGLWTANIAVAFLLVEPSRSRPPAGGHIAGVVKVVRRALVLDPRLRALILLTIVLGLSSFIPVWLVPLYAQGAGVPVAWLGPLWAVANYTVALGALWSDRLRDRWGLPRLLAVAIVLVAGGYMGLGLSHALFGFAFYFLLTTMRGLVGPALSHQEQRLIPSTDRAAIVSLRSLLFRLCFLGVAPVVGVAIERYGQHSVLLTLGPSLVLLGVLAWVVSRRSGAFGSLQGVRGGTPNPGV